MSDIRTRCERRCDKENDPSIDTPEWNALISEMYGELWTIVVQTGLRYFETIDTITITGAAYYTEPSDHYQTISVHQVYTDGTRREIPEAMQQELPNLSGLSGDAVKYSMIDDRIYFYPTPTSGTYEMLYTPQATDLSSYADGSSVDLVGPDGVAFLIWGVAVKAMHKSETDVSVAMQEREASRLRFAEEVQLRAFSSPRRRVIRDDDWISGLGYGYDPADWRNGR